MHVQNHVMLFSKRVANAVLHPPTVTVISLAMLALCMPSLAQDSFDLPTVTVPGVTNSSSTTEIIQGIIKYGGKFVIWSLVLASGIVYIKSTLKCVAKVRREEDGKWGDVFGEVIGGAIAVILIIALATWVVSTFLQ
jgi:hypothetical protein